MDTGCFEVRAGNTGNEVKLAMQRLWLTGQILPVGARLLVRHVFRNGEDSNLEVIYGFMLPRDAALRRFEVSGDGFEAHSELRRVEEAVKQYEEGIDAGHLSTLARAYRDGVVNLSLGNIKRDEQVTVTLEILAGVELRDDGLRFRFPFTLAPGYHRRMRAIDVDGAGEIELPSHSFGDVILPKFNKDANHLHQVGFDLALNVPGAITEVGSPSHAIRVRETHPGSFLATPPEAGRGGVSGLRLDAPVGRSYETLESASIPGRRVTLAPEADVPNRDLVLDLRVADPKTQVLAGAGHFAIVVPSMRFGAAPAAPRKVAVVIDRSGSMGGLPMAQAKRAVEACLGTLSPDDGFTIVAFDTQVETFQPTAVQATSDNRRAAQSFLAGIDARGGTELARGFAAGAKAVAGGGDVLVITDGQVMGTEDILAEARAQSVRIHCLGIGSASQDRFLAQLASSTGGVSRFVTPQERVDVSAVDLFASIGRPVAAGIRASGAVFGVKPADAAFAGSPWVAFGEGEPDRTVELTWGDGSLTALIPASIAGPDDTVRLLDGARRIADLESRMTAGTEAESTRSLAALSERFGLASRAMALVAVVRRTDDLAGTLPETRVVAVGMARDTEYGSYFRDVPCLGPTTDTMLMCAVLDTGTESPRGLLRERSLSPTDRSSVDGGVAGRRKQRPAGRKLDRFLAAFTPKRMVGPTGNDSARSKPPVTADPTDRLLDIAAHLSPDGGLVGTDPDDRALKTVSALLLFLSAGHTPISGAFRAHVERLVRFLEGASGLSAYHQRVVGLVIAFARAEKTPKQAQASTWADVEAAML